jgi:hypothetical protein
VGTHVGFVVGDEVLGFAVGTNVGAAVGPAVGCWVGAHVGDLVGAVVGDMVGLFAVPPTTLRMFKAITTTQNNH